MKHSNLVKAFLPESLLINLRTYRTIWRRMKYFRELKKLDPEELSTTKFTAHMLVVKNISYAPVAKVCVQSFLKFHPNSNIVVHVDKITSARVARILKNEIAKGAIRLEPIMEEDRSWQESKISLICALEQSNNFYMDADLRWNGVLTISNSPTFFVAEFEIGTNLKYREAFELAKLSWVNKCEMKNTSFFSWGNLWQDHQLKQKVWENFISIRNAVNALPLEDSLKLQLNRLSEQIALSASLNRIDNSVEFLKLKDGQMDGSFLESSYYGATGTSF